MFYKNNIVNKFIILDNFNFSIIFLFFSFKLFI